MQLKNAEGLVAERLGRGLQNLVQRFESARDLNKKGRLKFNRPFYFRFALFIDTIS